MSSIVIAGNTSGTVTVSAPAVAGSNTLTLPAATSTVATLLDIPTGVLMPYAGTSAPTGFLLCAGQAVSRTTYAGLFSIIGTTYGTGDGSTTFNLPDLRGRAVFGKDDMNGSAANRVTNGVSSVPGTTLGGAGGSEYMHGHAHAYGVGGVPANGVNVRGTSGDGTNFGYAYTENAGSGTSQNMPPALILNYIIKV
jgi:microcystin-dependent protein